MRLAWALLALVLLATTASPAHADSAEREAKKHFAKGKELIKKEKYIEAIAEIDAAYRLDPKNEHLYNLAVAYHLKGDRKAALEFYKRFLATNPRGKAGRDAERYARIVEEEIVQEREGRDDDSDGVKNVNDKCPEQAEDKDLFEDDDGCPDLDNDKDGLPDTADKCTMQAEDKDGVQDGDGCPDIDSDKDGLDDTADKCPKEAEDKDGVKDGDGCPDKDTDDDGDGFVGTLDLCPDRAGTSDGCPVSNKKGMPIVMWSGVGVAGAGLVLLGVGIGYGLQGSSAASDVEGASGMWSEELDGRVSTGLDANKNQKIFLLAGAGTVLVGGALIVVGLTVGGGEISPTVGPETAGFQWKRRF
jgi:Thrombospondin type 3 repeat/Tetratricopeptide repeat